MISNITDDFDIFIKECKDDKYKLKMNDYFKFNTSNNDNMHNNNIINNINYLFSFYPYKDYSLILECNKAIIKLYDNIKMSKYNSSIQKFFIQLKEIKDDSIFESSNEIISKNQYIYETEKKYEDNDEIID